MSAPNMFACRYQQEVGAPSVAGGVSTLEMKVRDAYHYHVPCAVGECAATVSHVSILYLFAFLIAQIKEQMEKAKAASEKK